jgi:hypothetical protein
LEVAGTESSAARSGVVVTNMMAIKEMREMSMAAMIHPLRQSTTDRKMS